MIAFVASVATTYYVCEHHPYRIEAPLREREVALTAPPQRAAGKVARESFDYLSKLQAFFASEGESA